MLHVMLTILVLLALYLLSLRGRTGHPGMAELRRWRYAHRGLHIPGRPENSMAAFRAALEGGYGIELDVHLLKDGTLAVIHDSSLERVTGLPGDVEDLTRADLKKCFLLDTGETIPEFYQVLELFAGKAPLIIELKSHRDNCAPLAEAVCRALEGYEGPYCLESFDYRCIRWLRKNRPELIRGQLSENFFGLNLTMSPILRFLATNMNANFLTRPDFIAYRFDQRKNPSCFFCRRLWGITGVSWTLRTPEDLETAEKEGWLPIFENFIP